LGGGRGDSRGGYRGDRLVIVAVAAATEVG
jgi:hypothetical protein